MVRYQDCRIVSQRGGDSAEPIADVTGHFDRVVAGFQWAGGDSDA
jgi:hypothetical protein